MTNKLPGEPDRQIFDFTYPTVEKALIDPAGYEIVYSVLGPVLREIDSRVSLIITGAEFEQIRQKMDSFLTLWIHKR